MDSCLQPLLWLCEPEDEAKLRQVRHLVKLVALQTTKNFGWARLKSRKAGASLWPVVSMVVSKYTQMQESGDSKNS